MKEEGVRTSFNTRETPYEPGAVGDSTNDNGPGARPARASDYVSAGGVKLIQAEGERMRVVHKTGKCVPIKVVGVCKGSTDADWRQGMLAIRQQKASSTPASPTVSSLSTCQSQTAPGAGVWSGGPDVFSAYMSAAPHQAAAANSTASLKKSAKPEFSSSAASFLRGRSKPSTAASTNHSPLSPSSAACSGGPPDVNHGVRGTDKQSNQQHAINVEVVWQRIELMSSGSLEDRVQVMRNEVQRMKDNPEEYREVLIRAGLVSALATNLCEVQALPSAVLVLVNLVSVPAILDGRWGTAPDSYPCLVKEQFERCMIIEKLLAVICWDLVPARLKGKIACIVQLCCKCPDLADRLIVQEGALRALTNLLDCEVEECAEQAANAIANASYWSTESLRQMNRVQIECAM